MASNVGRGRGYSGKNKDIIRGPATAADYERSGNVTTKAQYNNSDERFQDANTSSQRHVDNSLRNSHHTPHNTSKHHNKMDNFESSANDGASNVFVLNKHENISDSRRYSREFLRAISVSDENRQSVLYIDEKHHFLLKQLNLLSSQDDGILFNQKLQHIGEILSIQIKQLAGLRDALDAIASAAILDSQVSAKVSLLCCSVWFSSYKILGQKLHSTFIDALADKIEGLEVSLEGADQYLVNAASLLSNIFTEAKMLNQEELKTIARLIVQVIIELLECQTPLALKTLNIELMVHGRKLYQSVPDKVESLSISARKLLMARQPPAPSCRIWLTLLADLCLCKLEPLPKYLEDFYSVHLDESQITCEEKVHNPKVDHNRYSDVKNANTVYSGKSKVPESSDIVKNNGSNGEKGPKLDKIHNDEVLEEKSGLHDSSFDSSGLSDSNATESYECYNSNSTPNSERKPRPILGAGARSGHVFNVRDIDFSEPPPPINAIHQANEENIPKFCPNIPPPNYVPKQVKSASQDSADYWNTPPPTLQNNKMKDSNPTMQISSVLSKRLDLNSWRQETNGSTDYGNDSQFREEIADESESFDYAEDGDVEPEIQGGLLNQIKSDSSSMSDNSLNRRQAQVTPRSDKKRPGQVFYESKHAIRDSTSEDWDDTQINNLQVSGDSKVFDNSEKNRERNLGKYQDEALNDKQRSNNENRTPRDSGRQRNDRSVSDKNDSDEKENGRRHKEHRDNRGQRRTDRMEKTREKKVTDADKDGSGDDKTRSSGKQEKRSGWKSSTNRDSTEVNRSASYWTHDDRCDKEYDS